MTQKNEKYSPNMLKSQLFTRDLQYSIKGERQRSAIERCRFFIRISKKIDGIKIEKNVKYEKNHLRNG